MLKGNGRIGAQSMPTSEDLAKWGAYELSFEELLEVNGGKRDRSGGRSGGGRSSGSGGSSSKGSSGGESNKSSGGGVKSKETNKEKSKGSKTHTGSTGTEGKKNGGLSGNGLKGGEPKSKEEKKSGSTDYTVREGDTLSGIVRERYPGASKEEIAEKVKEVAKNSGIKDIDVIHPGDKIVFEKAVEPSSEAGSAEANTGKEKGSAERTSREGSASTGSGFLRGGGYRQGTGKSTEGGQALPEHKGLSGIQQKVSIQGTMYKEARSKISGVFDRIRDVFGNVNKVNAESYLGRGKSWSRKKETLEAQIQNVPKLSNEIIKKGTLFSKAIFNESHRDLSSLKNVAQEYRPSWPTESRRITSEFGSLHNRGIDIGAVNRGIKGDPIVASMGGMVTTSGIPEWSASQSPYVIIKGDDEKEYRYAHLDISPGIFEGRRVNQGELIGAMSDNGAEGQVHLHFEIRDAGKPLSPVTLLP